MSERFYFQIEAAWHRRRLDEFLFNQFESLSKIYLRGILKSGNCEINGYTANGGIVVKQNDFIEIELDAERETAMTPELIPLEIVYEDDALLLVNKPTEMLVHPTKGVKSGTLLNALAFYLNRKSEIQNLESKIVVRPGLVHRLDKKTSGLILISKTPRAHRVLSKHFQKKLVEKKYVAVVGGTVEQDSGTISQPIGNYAAERRWDVKADGKAAESKFRVLKRFADATLLELEPVTGRTNQLRIHCAYLGHPIIGDAAYSGREFPRLCLHARELSFQHPIENRLMTFETETPTDFPDYFR